MVSADLTERFAGDLAQLWPDRARQAGRLGVAVSGGPDSLALLLLSGKALPGQVAAATVDHGLRAESAGEAAMVAEICAGLGVEHATLRVSVSEGNIQSNARTARYAALAEWAEQAGVVAIATAHHADDQAETLLLRLNRGSGVAGLAGVRPLTRVPGSALALLRPLLGWRRSELQQVVGAAGLRPVDDPSNADPRFDRARLRAALRNTDWLDISAIAESAAHLAQADVALEWAAAREWAENVTRDGLGLTYRPAAPQAVALRVLARAVQELGGEEPRGSAVARLHAELAAGRPASIGDLVVRSTFDGWHFTPAPKRRS